MASITRRQGLKRKLSEATSEDCTVTLKLVEDLGLPNNFFKTGKARACALDPTDPAYQNIQTYVDRSKSKQSRVEVLSVLRIVTNLEGNLPMDHDEDPRNIGKLRKMLWHGTPPGNIAQILEKGLKMPVKESDPWFGLGIYFTDSFSSGLKYCGNWGTGRVKEGRWEVYVFLVDVLLGEVHRSYELIPEAPLCEVERKGSRKFEVVRRRVESIQGCGRRTPDPQGDLVIDGCVWPMGKLIVDKGAPRWGPMEDNEFVVYEARRVIPKYLVKVGVEEYWKD